MTAQVLSHPNEHLETTGCDAVVLVAAGDLSQRKLLSTLASAEARGRRGPDTHVLGVSRRSLQTRSFRGLASQSLGPERARYHVLRVLERARRRAIGMPVLTAPPHRPVPC